jgi:hypothetical protein
VKAIARAVHGGRRYLWVEKNPPKHVVFEEWADLRCLPTNVTDGILDAISHEEFEVLWLAATDATMEFFHRDRHGNPAVVTESQREAFSRRLSDQVAWQGSTALPCAI